MEKFLQDITKKAGKIILSKFGKVGVKYTKRDAADVVTEADLAANNYLIGQIKKKFPSHGIISEETGDYQKDAEYVWYIDPVDGTRNYSVGTPLYCTMVGLAQNGKMLVSAVYAPSLNQFYFAKSGRGAYLNGKRIKCSLKKEMKGSWGSASCKITADSLKIDKKMMALATDESIWVSSYACTGVNSMDIAAGRHDWFYSFWGGVWDYAAPSLILSESGCLVTDTTGKPWDLNDHIGMVAANKILHKEVLKAVK